MIFAKVMLYVAALLFSFAAGYALAKAPDMVYTFGALAILFQIAAECAYSGENEKQQED